MWHLILMILIVIVAIYLSAFSVSKLFDSDLPDWFSIGTMYIVCTVIFFGTIALECYLYARWLA